MGLRINQNIAAMNAYRNLSITQNQLSDSLEKLSSGFRINKAADDAAGLSISEGLRAQIGGLKQAVSNSQDAVNVVQTADGALTEVHAILQRMRDLAVQASNDGSQDANAQAAANTEFQQLSKELDRISGTTSFNGRNLLDGTYDGTFQVGANNTANDQIEVKLDGTIFGAKTAAAHTFGTVDPTSLDFSSTNLVVKLKVDGGSEQTITLSADYSNKVTGTGGMLEALQAGTTGATWSYDGTAKAFTLTSDTTGKTSSVEVTTVTGAGNSGLAVQTAVNGTGPTVSGFDSTGLGLSSISLTSTSGAQGAITAVDDAISGVSTARATLGAYQNRFQHTINNLNVTVQNLSASESQIRDTDMASEMVNFTRAQILQQAGVSMLAQANSIPQSVLKLLG